MIELGLKKKGSDSNIGGMVISMERVLMFVQAGCPFCRQAFQMIEQLKKEDPAYETVAIKVVDEKGEPELAALYDYWYVPTFFVDGVKRHEGVPTLEKIRKALRAALK